jgi:2,3-bisphosphoglycerate-dependent phosphoglycerate mutase
MEQVRRMDALTNSLVLVRHGESEWNRKNLFTGWKNPDLTDKGVIEARWAGRVLRNENLKFDIAFTSELKRAQHTLEIILDESQQPDVETIRDLALNERSYGDLSGLNKDEAKERWGEEQVKIWRRSFDIAPPGGESLKDTAARVLPYWEANIWPRVLAGETVIVVAHGNSLRALIMHLEDLTGDEIIARELATAAPLLYHLNTKGKVAERRELVTSKGRDHGLG